MIFGEDKYNIVKLGLDNKINGKDSIVIYDCNNGKFTTASIHPKDDSKNQLKKSNGQFIELLRITDNNQKYTITRLIDIIDENIEEILFNLRDNFTDYLLNDIEIILSIYDKVYEQYSNTEYQQWLTHDREAHYTEIIDICTEAYLDYGGVITDIPPETWLESNILDLQGTLTIAINTCQDVNYKLLFTDLQKALNNYNLAECQAILNRWNRL